MLSADDLLAGAGAEREVEIPAALLGDEAARREDRRVRLRALSVEDLRLVTRAGADRDTLTGALMVHRALVEPELTLAQVSALPVGLMEFLLREVSRLSGLTATEEEIAAAVEDPLAQATFRLAQAYGWTPQEIGALTLGEVLTHLQLLKSA